MSISNRVTVIVLLAIMSAIPALAGENAATGGSAEVKSATAPAAAPTPAPTLAPTALFRYGFEERVRTEDWNNLNDHSYSADDERHQIRFRTRMWLETSLPSSGITLYTRLDNEFKKQTLPDAKFNNDEVLVDNLYLDFQKTFIRGLSLRVGRQDLMRGEGMVLADGSSGDGSRTVYFNAVNLAYTRKKAKLELIGILDPRQDRFFPVGHNQHKNLNEWDQQAIGLYYTNRNSPQTDIDAYYFYTKETRDYRAPTNVQFQPDRHTSTLGARLVQKLPHGVSVTGEFAGQWGAQHANAALATPAADIRAWSGYGYVKKSLNVKTKPYLLGGYWLMSGDDPKTAGVIEGWDPIFSRWPKWSELYIYSLVPERGVAYWTNNRMLQAEAGFTPWKPLTVRATYYHSDAFHAYTPGSATIFGTGTRRGENVQLRGDYVVNKNIKTHMLFEHLSPGSFYRVKDGGFFFRAEIMYTFQGSVAIKSARN